MVDRLLSQIYEYMYVCGGSKRIVIPIMVILWGPGCESLHGCLCCDPPRYLPIMPWLTEYFLAMSWVETCFFP